MKILRWISIIFLSLLAVILIVALVLIGSVKKSGLPDYSEDIQLSGLSQTVSVYRDSLAIPHIYAKNEHDLYMAVGYLSAQDRMWQMDFLRRVTLGRLSEIFGDDYIETDLFLRSLRFSRKSEWMRDSADRKLVNALQAYADGVNAWIEDNKGNYPLEFRLLGYEPEPWDIIHSMNLGGFMAWDLKAGWYEYVLEDIASVVDSVCFLELIPDLAKQKTVIINDSEKYRDLLAESRLKLLAPLGNLGVDIFSGSNNWAVTGKKTSTGKPLVANDMHLSYNLPGIWMQMHQVIEGEMNVTGLVLPGAPFVIDGHNDSVAWGMTNTFVDNLDYYAEEVHPDDSMKYMFNGKWEDFTGVREVIRSKSGRVDTGFYRLNHRGPVVSSIKEVEDRVLTIHWVGDEYSNELRSVYLVNRAKNMKDFTTAFETFKAISQNVVYADKQGNIGLFCCAGVPIRKRDKFMQVLPGNTDEYDWQGMVPFEELPKEINPARGFVSSANSRTVDSTYPYHIGTWYDMPYRMNRIREMLTEKDIYSVEDFKRMQNDQQSVFSEFFLGRVLPLMDTTAEWSGNEMKALTALQNWNFNLDKAGVEATISEYWWYQFLKLTYSDELGEDLFKKFISNEHSIWRIALHQLLLSKESAWLDIQGTEETEDFADIATLSFKEAVAELEQDCGMDPGEWQWGNIHMITLKHPVGEVDALDKVFKLNRGPYPVGGSYHTVKPYNFPLFEPAAVHKGASHRSIYDLSDWDNTISVIPTGMSGIPASKHYCDQTELYIQGAYHPDYFSREAVTGNKKYSMEFRP